MKSYSECLQVLKDVNYMSCKEIEEVALGIAGETTDWLLEQLRKKPEDVIFDVISMTFTFEEKHRLHDLIITGFGHYDCDEAIGECIGSAYKSLNMTHECFFKNRERILWSLMKVFEDNGYKVEKNEDKPDVLFVRFENPKEKMPPKKSP